jgi:group I intron endonuclease
MDVHIIYKITNVINEKIYIRQTKQYYSKTKYGINGRFKTHIVNAFKSKPKFNSGCPKLENAIRKYGKECFVVEELEKTNADKVDELEEYYIKEHDSTNNNIGYNISLGGKGRKIVYVPEEARQKISKSLNKDKNDGREMNIIPYKDKKTGVIIGFRARRKEHERYAEKHFTSKKKYF